MRIIGWILDVMDTKTFAALLVVIGVVIGVAAFLSQPWFWHVLEDLLFVFHVATPVLEFAIDLLASFFFVWAGLVLWRSNDLRA